MKDGRHLLQNKKTVTIDGVAVKMDDDLTISWDGSKVAIFRTFTKGDSHDAHQ